MNPEGYCRNYADAATACPWRFDDTPPADSPTKEQPRGRDYFGGDLKGVDQQLDYLKALGVNTIYFNPIFDAGLEPLRTTPRTTRRSTRTSAPRRTGTTSSSTPRTAGSASSSTACSTTSRPTARSSTATATTRRSAPASRRARRSAAGSCSATSPRAPAPAPGPTAPKSATYEGWFGFDSIPVIDKAASNTVGLGVLPDRLRRDRQALAQGGRRRLAPRRLGRRVVPGRLLGDLPRGRQGDQPRRADDQRDVAEGLDAAADDPRRPPRHDDELPAPGRRPRRSWRRARSTPRASPTAATSSPRPTSSTGCPRSARTTRTPPTTRS